MKKKYYLRGLGVGIFLTAVIMGIFTKDGNSMTDEEIKKRALELGMVDHRTLADVVVETNENATVTEPQVPQKADDVSPSTPLPTDTPIPSEAPIDTPEPTITNDEIVVMQIVKGDTSNSVSKKLEELGLIENAKSFNKYLCEKGYERKLNIDTYEIKLGTSEKEIAKIITHTN